MAGKKISRKQLLKEPDEFFTTTGKVIRFLKENRRRVAVYGTAALAVFAAVLLGYAYFRWEEGKAQAIQQEGLQLFQEAQAARGNAEKEKEAFQKALAKFEEADRVYGRGTTGHISQIYIGHSRFALQEFDAAVRAYASALEGPVRALARQGLGYVYEAQGDYAKALEHFLKNAESETGVFQEEGLLGSARAYEALNRKTEALEAYRKALAGNPKSMLAGFIQWKVGELEG